MPEIPQWAAQAVLWCDSARRRVICYSAKVMISHWNSGKKMIAAAALLLCCAIGGVGWAAGQQSTAPPAAKPAPGAPPKTEPQPAPGTASKPETKPESSADFAAAADEVLDQMSDITGLKLRSPLKKSLKTREQLRQHLIQEMNEDKDEAERYAGQRSAEAFGLLPKGFDLDSFLIDLLTEQVAGLYDPEAHEFYVADWIPIADQRMVMAHELTHALEDQHFQIDKWVKAARPDDDAELARESVLEGSAMAAMVDFLLAGSGRSLQDLPDIDPANLVGDMENSPMLQKAPPFLKDALVFPYLDGLSFTAAVLRPDGWSALPGIFAKPPVTTQQIMHPALYSAGKAPEAVTLPSMDKSLGGKWKRLEENTMGEFGWKEVLKQFLGEERAAPLASAWDGDRYVCYEQKQTKRLLLITRERLASKEQADRFFGQYSEGLEKKHAQRTNLLRRPNFFSFDTAEGGVFLKCEGRVCVTLEGGDRAHFIALNKALNWSPVPEPLKQPDTTPRETAGRTRARTMQSGAAGERSAGPGSSSVDREQPSVGVAQI